MIVIGSVAAMENRLNIDQPVPADLDLVGTYDEACAFRKTFEAVVFYPINKGKSLFLQNKDGAIAEVEVAWEGSRAAGLLAFAAAHPWHFVSMPETGFLLPSSDVLYMLKMSHRYLKDSPHFLKTMRDIHGMRSRGAKIGDDMHGYYEQRMRETYTYNHPRLGMSKGAFFDPAATGVTYTYDHDSIHEAVKIGHKPAYTYFKPTCSDVMCDREMFFVTGLDVRINAVLEESCVLALERSLILFPGAKTPKDAFDMALMKVCTSITSGWFREFAWENYAGVQEAYAVLEADYGAAWYLDKFSQGLTTGVVKKI